MAGRPARLTSREEKVDGNKVKGLTWTMRKTEAEREREFVWEVEVGVGGGRREDCFMCKWEHQSGGNDLVGWMGGWVDGMGGKKEKGERKKRGE